MYKEKYFNIKIITFSAETLTIDRLCNLLSELRDCIVTWYHPENPVTPAKSVSRTRSVGRSVGRALEVAGSIPGARPILGVFK